MQKISFKDVNPGLKDFYNRALDASRRNDNDYAISTLKAVVQKSPGFADARAKLRELELKKFDEVGGPGLGVAFYNLRNAGKLRKLVESAPLKALAGCEDGLAMCVNNPAMLKIMVDAAEKAGAPFIAAEALELLVRFNPRNRDYIERLVAIYQSEEQLDDIVKIYQSLTLQFPNDMDLQNQLREATRAAGRAKGKQAEASTAESLTLQIEDGIIRDPAQARVVIDKYNTMLKEADSIDIRRKLASAYMVAGDYDGAARELEYVAKTLGALDPQLDKLIEKAYLAKFDASIHLLQTNPDAYENSERQLAEFIRARSDFRLDRARKRLAVYPQDAQLHLDLGHLYVERDELENAIAEYTEAAGSLQKRAHARVGLARVMMRQERWSEAVDYFQQALGELIKADRFKLDAMYDLARCYEAAGELSKALETFKEILQNNVKFRDVKQQIDRLTAAE